LLHRLVYYDVATPKAHAFHRFYSAQCNDVLVNFGVDPLFERPALS